jgi:AraC-like DNA-binding protein
VLNMGYKTTKQTKVQIGATLDDGSRAMLEADVTVKGASYVVTELNERMNLRNTFKAISEACRSSADITILGEILERTDIQNEIRLHSLTEWAAQLNVSRKHLNTLLTRAEDASLLYKLNTGHYLLNPYKIMGAKASAAGYEIQELAQVRWKELTGLYTELEIQQLLDLSDYLKLENGLTPTYFNLSVAQYYSKNKTISPKQRTSMIKAGIIKL